MYQSTKERSILINDVQCPFKAMFTYILLEQAYTAHGIGNGKRKNGILLFMIKFHFIVRMKKKRIDDDVTIERICTMYLCMPMAIMRVVLSKYISASCLFYTTISALLICLIQLLLHFHIIFVYLFHLSFGHRQDSSVGSVQCAWIPSDSVQAIDIIA